MDSIGESYEVFAESLVSRIATLTRIGSKQDFGTDIYCLPRISTQERTETVTELCLLQVKGGAATVEYGGLDRDGHWRDHELEWLKSLWAPLYLARVDPQYQRVGLFSLWPIWWIMWQCGTPFKVVCSWKDAADVPYVFSSPTTSQPADSNQGPGDGRVWAIDLGPPFLELTHHRLNDENFHRQAVDIFRHWIQLDRQTVARFHARVPLVDAVRSWASNQMPASHQKLLAWDPRPGMNIDWLARALVPSLLGLGVHLQWQNNPDAHRLIPILEWVEENGYGDDLTRGLLDGLSRTQREGVGPATHVREKS